MKLKNFKPEHLTQRDRSLYEQALIARKDPLQWRVVKVYASMVQDALLEDVLINESNIMHHTMNFYNNEHEEE